MKANLHRFFENLPRWGISIVLLSSLHAPLYASSGTEGAAFLDIPVGARPASLGSAYSALATDGYAPTYNPAGLGFLKSQEITAMHLSYLVSMNYEYASYVQTINSAHAAGISIQYLLPGSITGTDENGLPLGDI